MAFPVPSHLPRKVEPHDVSSSILSKIGEASLGSFDASLARTWLVELDAAILNTKEKIHERIHADLPSFERQLSTSRSVQARLQTLTKNVDILNETLSNPETGTIPTLVRALSAHADLAQDSLDEDVNHETLSHLLKIREDLCSVSALIQAGKLPDAIGTCEELNGLLDASPSPLDQSKVMLDLKREFRAAKNRAEEQLSEAYSRSIIITPNELIVRPSVQIRQSDTILTLPSILSALSSNSLSAHLASLRRDLITYYVDHLLQQPSSITVTSSHDPSGIPEYKLCQFVSPPDAENQIACLENLVTVITFLSTNIFPYLPKSQVDSFARTLSKPVSTGLLNHLLIPSLPSSFSSLPSFLGLLKRAVSFEEQFIIEKLGNDKLHKSIKEWADGVGGHYERKRRLDILAKARILVVEQADWSNTLSVEAEILPEPAIVPIQEVDVSNTWNFDDRAKLDADLPDEDGWGFNDDVEDVPEDHQSQELKGNEDPDPEDAWGWNDEVASGVAEEEIAWDDPWGDEPGSHSLPAPVPTVPKPVKPATRLEKFSTKSKKSLGNGESSTATPEVPSAKFTEKRPPSVTTGTVLNETFLISAPIKGVTQIVEDALQEGKDLIISQIFIYSDTNSLPGSLLLQSATAILDLIRALYPIKFRTELATFSEKAMRFSNDCLYLSREIQRIERAAGTPALITDKLKECSHQFNVLGDSWFDDSIEKERQLVNDTLTSTTQGFMYTADQDQYDECENAVGLALKTIRSAAQRWKIVLAKSKYYTAIGQVADAALSRLLEDVLALPDIPEVESHRLSELCRILNALEGLFVEDPSQPSFIVAYVPSWLKFSYLSELLEASMADISYLFEEGALVDFEVHELATLVRALFADTPLRTATINKLLAGHPVSQ